MRAAIAVEFRPTLAEEAKSRQQEAGQRHGRGMDSSGSPDPQLSKPDPHRARNDAGALVGVSGATVDLARPKRLFLPIRLRPTWL